jgi:hypothetical protein
MSNSKIKALKDIEKSKYLFFSLPRKLRDNKEIVFAVMHKNVFPYQNAYFFKQLSKKIRGDKDIVLAFVKIDGRLINYASEELRKD